MAGASPRGVSVPVAMIRTPPAKVPGSATGLVSWLEATSLAFPGRSPVAHRAGHFRRISPSGPLTVAGPHRSLTGFPIRPVADDRGNGSAAGPAPQDWRSLQDPSSDSTEERDVPPSVACGVAPPPLRCGPPPSLADGGAGGDPAPAVPPREPGPGRLHVRGGPLHRAPLRGDGHAPHLPRGLRTLRALQSGRTVDRLLGGVRRYPPGLPDPGGGRHPEAAHLLPGRGAHAAPGRLRPPRPGLDARREEDPHPGEPDAVRAAGGALLPGGPLERGTRGAARDSRGRVGCHLRSHGHEARLQRQESGVAALEALPWRPAAGRLALRPHPPHEPPDHHLLRHGRLPHVDRGPGVLRLGPGREPEAEHLGLRHPDRGDAPGDPPHGVRRPLAEPGRRRDRLRERGFPLPPGSRDGGDPADPRHDPRRPAVHDPLLQGGGGERGVVRHLAQREAGPLRRPGGDLHGSGEGGERPQPLPDSGGAGAERGVVSRREVDRLPLRRFRGVRSVRDAGGPLRRAPASRGGHGRLDRRAPVVARLEVDRLRGQLEPPPGRGDRLGADRGRGPGHHGRAGGLRMVARLAVDRLCEEESEQPERRLALLLRERDPDPGHGRRHGRVEPRLRPGGPLPLLRLGAGLQLPLRRRELLPVPDLRGHAPGRRAPPLPAPERRGAGGDGGESVRRRSGEAGEEGGSEG